MTLQRHVFLFVSLCPNTHALDKVRPAKHIPNEKDPEYYVLQNPEYVDLDTLHDAAHGEPFVVAVINRDELKNIDDDYLKTKIQGLRQKTPLKKEDFSLDKIMMEYPQIIETVVIDTGDSNHTDRDFIEIFRKLAQAAKVAVKSRKTWRRGRSNQARGPAVSINSRVNHHGQLG